MLACSTLAACNYPDAGGGLRLLFFPQQQTSPIKPIPRSLAVGKYSSWNTSKITASGPMGREQPAYSASSGGMAHPDHGYFLEDEVPCCFLTDHLCRAACSALLCVVVVQHRCAAPTRHLSNANTVTGKFLLKTSTRRAMCYALDQARETLLKLCISLF